MLEIAAKDHHSLELHPLTLRMVGGTLAYEPLQGAPHAALPAWLGGGAPAKVALLVEGGMARFADLTIEVLK
ncbi:MAG: hypothetical protein ACKO32_07615 [Planctomycetia bacterium]